VNQRFKSPAIMGQQRLIYSFVAHGKTILAEHTDFTGNFKIIAAQGLRKLPPTNTKISFKCDNHTFNYIVDNGFGFCVVAEESLGKIIPMACLERIKDDFRRKYGGGKADSAQAFSLSKQFGKKLKNNMQYCADHPEEISRLAKVEDKILEMKGIAMENLEKIFDRGIKIEAVVEKAEDLRGLAEQFKRQGNQLRRKMWWRKARVKVIVVGILVASILVIAFSVFFQDSIGGGKFSLK